MFLSTVAKNEADRQAEKREIKRRLTRKVRCPSVRFPSISWVHILYLNGLFDWKEMTSGAINCYENRIHDANIENTALSGAFPPPLLLFKKAWHKKMLNKCIKFYLLFRKPGILKTCWSIEMVTGRVCSIAQHTGYFLIQERMNWPLVISEKYEKPTRIFSLVPDQVG